MEPPSEYDQWVRPIEERMMRTVWRIVRDPDDAEDAFQQALETVWRRWARVRRHPNPQALIMTICVHAAYDLLRRRHRRGRHEVPDIDPERHRSADGSARERLEAGEARAAILDAIGALPEKQRTTASLRLLTELPFHAIAEALGCSEATARTHYMRALKALRGRLAPLRPQIREEVHP